MARNRQQCSWVMLRGARQYCRTQPRSSPKGPSSGSWLSGSTPRKRRPQSCPRNSLRRTRDSATCRRFLERTRLLSVTVMSARTSGVRRSQHAVEQLLEGDASGRSWPVPPPGRPCKARGRSHLFVTKVTNARSSISTRKKLRPERGQHVRTSAFALVAVVTHLDDDASARSTRVCRSIQ
jgi:hypothetical protein